MSFLRTHGHLLYLYNIPFVPRALPTRAFWTKSQTSFSFIPLSSNITIGSWVFGKSLRGSIGILFKSSEYVILKWFLCSSFSTSSFPRKNFLQKHKDLSRMIWRFFFQCFLWFSALEITKILFWISFRIFWSSNLSWIRASFNRHFRILCSDLNFPFCICHLFGCFSLVLFFYALLTSIHR